VLSAENIDEALEAECEWATMGDAGSTFDPGEIAAVFFTIYRYIFCRGKLNIYLYSGIPDRIQDTLSTAFVRCSLHHRGSTGIWS
jgi:hypothetical protein